MARVVDLGFEIRVELRRADETLFWVQLARSSLPPLGLREEQRVWVSAVNAPGEQQETQLDRKAAVAG